MTFPPGTPEIGWAIPEERRAPEWGDRQQVGPRSGARPRRDEELWRIEGLYGGKGPVRGEGT